ncbi:MAG: PLD-like domain-containing protein [Glomeribacter sp. 1016415]|nr:PLD-like domain-containing protein [Glomeribacter sp. 1016415]
MCPFLLTSLSYDFLHTKKLTPSGDVLGILSVLVALSECSFHSCPPEIPISVTHKLQAPFSCSQIQPCFVPGENCEEQIVQQIAKAKRLILVQAYSFTSKPIVTALLAAHQRCVKVQVILDKSQLRQRYSQLAVLHKHHIPVWMDMKPKIAHSKVMVIDGAVVITGSFNFSKSAQIANAENLLVIHDATSAQQYTRNWEQRREQSQPLESVLAISAFSGSD